MPALTALDAAPAPKTGMTARRPVLLLFLALALVPSAYKLTLSPEVLVNGFLPDDAFYYYKTAFNIHDGYGSTFDTIHETNGYHPLWMLICSGLSFVTRDPAGYVTLVLAVNAVVLGLLGLQLYKMFEPRLGVPLVGLLTVLVMGNAVSGSALLSGLETGIAALLVLVAVERTAHGSVGRTRDYVFLGGLFALAFLARTDFVLCVPVLLALILWRIRSRGARVQSTRMLVLVGALGLCVLPYLIWNLHVTGHLQQISGLVKSTRNDGILVSFDALRAGLATVGKWVVLSLSPVAFHAQMSVPDMGSFGKWIAALVALIVPVHLLATRSRVDGLRDPRLLALTGMSILLLGYYLVEYGADVRPWHLTLVVITLQLWFVHTVRDWIASTRSAGRVLLVSLVVCFGVCQWTQTFAYRRLYDQVNYRFVAPVHYSREVARWMSQNIPPEATIGVWNAGFVGYFSGRRVVNLDGLINGRTLYEYLSNGPGVWQYIEDQGIDYISDYYFGDPAPEQSEIAGRLSLVHRVGRSVVTQAGAETFVDWYVWRVVPEPRDPSADAGADISNVEG